MDQINDLGPALINDDGWTLLFGPGNNYFTGITVRLTERTVRVNPLDTDQLGNPRPADLYADIGAIEIDN